MDFATVRTIVTDTVTVIWDEIQATGRLIPDEDKLTSVAEKLFARCDYTLYLGAIGGHFL